MSDYRYQIKKHNGIDCLHVMIDGPDPDVNGEEIIQTHIPIDDILSSLIRVRAQEYQGILIQATPPALTLEQFRAVVREELQAALLADGAFLARLQRLEMDIISLSEYQAQEKEQATCDTSTDKAKQIQADPDLMWR